MPIEINLEGKVALVTGAATGIGQSIAVTMAKAGADMAINDLDEHRCSTTQGEVRKLGRRGFVAAGNVADGRTVEAIVSRVVGEFGKIDILVNNAGFVVRKPVSEMNEDEWDKIIDVNLKGAFLCSKYVARSMIEKKVAGRIVSISSIMGEVALPTRAAYCASKGGIISMTRELAVELAPYKINVNSVGPGWVTTGSTEQYFAQEEVRKFLLDRIPLGRFCSPTEVAGLVTFLASDLANYLTGQTIFLDGGWTAS